MKKILTLFLLLTLATPCFAETVTTSQFVANMDKQWRQLLNKPNVTMFDAVAFTFIYVCDINNYTDGFSKPVTANLTKVMANYARSEDSKAFYNLSTYNERVIRESVPVLKQNLPLTLAKIDNPETRQKLTEEMRKTLLQE